MSDSLARLRHDLRTPVNHIQGYAELLIEDCDAQVYAVELEGLHRIRRAASDMLAAIDDGLPSDGLPSDAPALHLGTLAARLRECAARVHAEVGRLRGSDRLPSGAHDDLDRIAAAAAALAVPSDRAPEPPRPHRDPEVSPAGPPANLMAGSAPPPSRILVADDDVRNRELLGRRLAREGHLVVYASDGADALALLETASFDLVLLDVVMPGVDGEEVLRRLKADRRHADVPVLMISALNEQDAVVRCIAAGADDYLPKPVDPVLLRARLGACLARKRARDQEVEYLRQVGVLTTAAQAVKAGTYNAAALEPVSRRDDALGELARVFRHMVREVRARERRLSEQVAQLRIEVDEAKKAQAVSEIVETEHFAALQRRAAELRRSTSSR